MTIKYAILGLLSWKSFSGYDLKKMFTNITAFYWSGNNNQIYRTLVQLLGEGLVTHEVQYQENSPNKKIYTITEEGKAELKKWVLSNPEPPELRKTFLIQLAWADQLSSEEIDSLLTAYAREVEMQMLMEQEKVRRKVLIPERTPRESYLWQMMTENIISSYESELNWVKRLREGLKKF
ncbi:MAG: PadR family transcriptional regulator [Acidobacteriota bacterium]